MKRAFGSVPITLSLALAVSACGRDPGQPATDHDSVDGAMQALADVDEAPTDVRLLRLSAGVPWQDVATPLESLGGEVFHVLPDRLLTVRFPAGFEPILSDLGVEEIYAGAVHPDDIPGVTDAEARFARVFSNRYYPREVPRDQRIHPTRRVRPEGEPFEAPLPSDDLATPATFDSLNHDATPEQERENERRTAVHFASGTVVVALMLPESNGVAEPSLEDWTEDSVAEVHHKLYAALDAYKRHEPNADLRFVVHNESAPTAGGVPGTLEIDYEWGVQAEGPHRRDAMAQMLSHPLERRVEANEVQAAHLEYVNALRDRYNADGAFVLYIGHSSQRATDFRAFAARNGPYTAMPSSDGWGTLMHELGHIFGAADEYCPDACRNPTETHGYTAIMNANARYRLTDGGPGGINAGFGEDQIGIMNVSNRTNQIHGYARGAWGWLDLDGDGRIYVRDTFPKSELQATLRDNTLHLTGWVTDVPATPRSHGSGFSANRLTALEYRVDQSPWFEHTLPGRTRGREELDLDLLELPSGKHVIQVRAVNSVGNKQPKPTELEFDVSQGVANAAPLIRITPSRQISVVGQSTVLRASAFDVDGDSLQVDFDLDGDGRYETPSTRDLRVDFTPMRAGMHQVSARALDARGASRVQILTVYVADEDIGPQIDIAGTQSPLFGGEELFPSLRAVHGEQEVHEYNWKVEHRSQDGSVVATESGFSTELESFVPRLAAVPSLRSEPIALAQGEMPESSEVRDVVAIDSDTLALALGGQGVMLMDIREPSAARILATLPLETEALHLYARGEQLLVLGSHLSFVDVSNRERPRELKRLLTDHRWLTSAVDSEEPRRDGSRNDHLPTGTRGEKIADLGVDLVVDHPDHSQITIELMPPNHFGLDPIRLKHPGGAGSGVVTYRYDSWTTPALRDLRGGFTTDMWSLRVVETRQDASKDPEAPLLRSSRLWFHTAQNAYRALAGADEIVGEIDERYVLLKGDGLQLIDARFPRVAFQVARLRGPHVHDAVIDGDYVAAAADMRPGKPSATTAPLHDPEADPEAQTVRGVFAVDFTTPFWPEVVREELEWDVFPYIMKAAGDRFYMLQATGNRAVTVVSDLRAFVTGSERFELGRFPMPLRPYFFGDNHVVWNVDRALHVSSWDVSDPAHVELIDTYQRPTLREMARLDEDRALVRDSRGRLSVMPLEHARSTTSRMHFVTLEARDVDGNISRAHRSIHHVPYNEAPQITTIEVESGDNVREPWVFAVSLRFPQDLPDWDPNAWVRADTDGDGVFDTPWVVHSRDTVRIEARFDSAGERTLRFQARDGFYALSELYEITVDVAPPTQCLDNSDCPDDAYCAFTRDDSCGQTSAGICEPLERRCEWEPPSPVCGCDGSTYRTACEANLERVSVAYEGWCTDQDRTCNSSDDCDTQQFCRFGVEQACGSEGTGTCDYGGEQCEPTAEPVCGCDGRSYETRCDAHYSGTSVRHFGYCEDDCRVTGCEPQMVCQRCWSGYTCLPEGTFCTGAARSPQQL